MNFLYVGIGGAIGSIARYGISLLPISSLFPFATLIANIVGAFIIGFISVFAPVGLSDNYTLLLKTGFCGGFTTFSTFSLEAFMLLENGQTCNGIIYIFVSLVGCLIGIFLGRYMALNILR